MEAADAPVEIVNVGTSVLKKNVPLKENPLFQKIM
jgi:hypothetical protein